MSEFQEGATIDGRYRVLSRVGAGGMADVYLAQDEQLGREVALKLLHRRFAADPGFVERFRREAQAAASLQHPNVVSVFDRGTFDDTYYIAMEYLPGRSLKQLIREEAPLEPGRAVDLAIQILKAARFAHRRGVIHRDLKPHNVIVDDNDHVKVTDFGIARAGASDMTETGSIMGTAQYLSPEQAQGHAVSAPSDLYSVGVVLYEMLTGRVPFDGESAVTIALKHVSEAPVPPSQINPAVSPALDQVVMWSLNKDPADRPSDADQLIAALEQVRGAVTGPAGEITATMRAVSAGGPARGAIVPFVAGGDLSGNTGVYPRTSVLPASDAAGVYGTAAHLQVSGDRLDRYDDDRDDRHKAPVWPWLLALLILLLIGGGVAAYLLTRPQKESVPDVVGLNIQTAENRLAAANLHWTLASQSSTQYDANTVMSQVPGGPGINAKLNSGSSVALTVSSGAGSIQVPYVAGEGLALARRQLKEAGLTIANTNYKTSPDENKGLVISVTPPGGQRVPHGTSVVLLVSSGLSAVVPNVSNGNYTASQAEQILGGSGFKVTTVAETTTTSQPGTVVDQTPPPTTTVASGSTVTLTVANAPKTATVPGVIGYTSAGAQSTLQGAGFYVIVRDRPVDDPSQVNNVINQYPQPQAVRKKGSQVTIVVGVARPNTNTVTRTTPTNSTPTTSTTSSTTTTSGQTTTTG